MKTFKAQEIMSSEVATCRAEDSESKAAQLMWERDCGIIPVVDASEHVVGLVTDRDLCMGAYTSGKCLSELPVAHSMSSAAYSCGAGDSIEDVLGEMTEHKLHRVPIVDGEKRLVGVISMNDIVRHVAKLKDGGDRKRLESSVVQAMAAICEPREAPHSLVPQKAAQSAAHPSQSRVAASSA